MPDGQRESYEAVPRRPEQQETEGPALSMALCSLFICDLVSNIPCPCLIHTLPYLSPLLLIELVHLLPCLSHTMSCLSPLLLPELVHLLLCLSLTLSPYPPYSVSLSTLPCPLIHLTLSPYPPYPAPTLSQKK